MNTIGRFSGVFDRNGIPVMEGDLLKVYHFTGARRKKFYMYKKVLWVKSGYMPDGGLHAINIQDLGEKPLEECNRCKITDLESFEVIEGYSFDSPIDGTFVTWEDRKQKRSGFPQQPKEARS